jgi:hypothetical protein
LLNSDEICGSDQIFFWQYSHGLPAGKRFKWRKTMASDYLEITFVFPVRYCLEMLPPFPGAGLRKMSHKLFAQDLPGNVRLFHPLRRVE